jgi:hypothetical protein
LSDEEGGGDKDHACDEKWDLEVPLIEVVSAD